MGGGQWVGKFGPVIITEFSQKPPSQTAGRKGCGGTCGLKGFVIYIEWPISDSTMLFPNHTLVGGGRLIIQMLEMQRR